MKVHLRGKASATLYFSKLRKLHQVLNSENCLAAELFVSVVEQLICGDAEICEDIRSTIRSRAGECSGEFSQFCVFITALLRDFSRRIMGESRRLSSSQLAAIVQDFGLSAYEASGAVERELQRTKYRDGRVSENQFCDFVAEVSFKSLDVDHLVQGLQQLAVRVSALSSETSQVDSVDRNQPICPLLSQVGTVVLQRSTLRDQMEMVRAVARWSARVFHSESPATSPNSQPASLSLSWLNPTAGHTHSRSSVDDVGLGTPGVSIGLNPLKAHSYTPSHSAAHELLEAPARPMLSSASASVSAVSSASGASRDPEEQRQRLMQLFSSVQREISTLEHEVFSCQLPAQLPDDAEAEQSGGLKMERDELREAYECLSKQLELVSAQSEAQLSSARRERDGAKTQLAAYEQQNRSLERRSRELERGHMELVNEIERLDCRDDERSRALASLQASLEQKTGECAEIATAYRELQAAAKAHRNEQSIRSPAGQLHASPFGAVKPFAATIKAWTYEESHEKSPFGSAQKQSQGKSVNSALRPSGTDGIPLHAWPQGGWALQSA